MKHSIVLKFLALTLTVLSLVAAVGGVAGIVSMESANLYITGPEFLQDQAYESISKSIATTYAETYAMETLGDIPYTLRDNLYNDPSDRPDAEHWHATLSLGDGIEDSKGPYTDTPAFTKEFKLAPLYAVASLLSPKDMEELQNPKPTDPKDPEKEGQDTSRDNMVPEQPVPEGYLYYSEINAWRNGSLITYYLYYYQAPEYTISVQLQEKVLENSYVHLLTILYPHRYTFIAALALCLLFAAVSFVYLMISAGCCADGSIHPGGLNRLPLDLYALLAGSGIFGLSLLFSRLYDWMYRGGPHLGNLSLLGVNLLGICLLGCAFLFALAAQVKTKDAFWWRNSLLGRLCSLLGKLFRWFRQVLAVFFLMLPVIWRWLTLSAILALTVTITFLLATSGSFLQFNAFGWLLTGEVLLTLAVVFYGSYCFGVLFKGARQMSQGDLSHKIPTQYLRGSFRQFAQELNALSETAQIAAQKQMQSERMRSELITNVSHDIKTPLTSIINFVDLLQKTHSPQEQKEYLEVLARQSARMKKLIDDLMELSKASSGNITVHLQEMDAVETVNQALGEFSDKLESAGLVSVFQPPQDPIPMLADGRLVWRVLSNLLTNATKYALPGTRVYVDLVKADDLVLLSLKNISREPLNVPAEELLERFVRGDAARKGDGSGLGLNIAKTLMDVQGGQLQLMLDGDLFKITLVFPAAE